MKEHGILGFSSLKQNIMKKIFYPITLLVFSFSSLFGSMSDRDYAASLKISTLGLGLEAQTSIYEKLNFRLGVNNWQYDDTSTEGGISYDTELQLFTFSALVDWHPFNGIFRVSTGLMLNNNEIDLNGKITGSQTVSIGNKSYVFSAGTDSINGSVEFNDIAPYLGIGWGNALGPDKNWGFLFDIGILFQGSPDVSLTANAPSLGAVVQADINSEIANEIAQLENDIDGFDIYPVVSLGVSYKF